MATQLSSNYVNKLANGFLEGWDTNLVLCKGVSRSKICLLYTSDAADE